MSEVNNLNGGIKSHILTYVKQILDGRFTTVQVTWRSRKAVNEQVIYRASDNGTVFCHDKGGSV